MTKSLAELRKEKGKTQSDMAEILGVGVSTYNMYENGSRKIPKETAEKISRILEVEIGLIFLPATFTLSKIIGRDSLSVQAS